MSDNFPLFIFLCVVKNQKLSLLWKEGMEQLGLEEPKHGSLIVPDRQVQKHSQVLDPLLWICQGSFFGMIKLLFACYCSL